MTQLRTRSCSFAGMCLVGLAALLAGCETGRGEALRPDIVPEDTPPIGDILAELDANDAALETLQAEGAIFISSPELKSDKRCRGSVLFRRPGDLRILGTHRLQGTLFRIVCAGPLCLVAFPTEERYSLTTRDQPLRQGPLQLSAAELQTMFFPERWSEIEEIRLVEAEELLTVTRLAFETGPEERPDRRLTVLGPPWRLSETVLLGPAGETAARVERDDYRVKGGLYLPGHVVATFPREQTEIELRLTEINPNVPIEGSPFDIDPAYRRDVDAAN